MCCGIILYEYVFDNELHSFRFPGKLWQGLLSYGPQAVHRRGEERNLRWLQYQLSRRIWRAEKATLHNRVPAVQEQLLHQQVKFNFNPTTSLHLGGILQKGNKENVSIYPYIIHPSVFLCLSRSQWQWTGKVNPVLKERIVEARDWSALRTQVKGLDSMGRWKRQVRW